jgi:hypothetical protein
MEAVEISTSAIRTFTFEDLVPGCRSGWQNRKVSKVWTPSAGVDVELGIGRRGVAASRDVGEINHRPGRGVQPSVRSSGTRPTALDEARPTAVAPPSAARCAWLTRCRAGQG